MKRGFTILGALIILSLPSFAGEWIENPLTKCAVWNPYPQPDEIIIWTGKCVNGKASGNGTLQWYVNETKGGRYEGDFLDGKANGWGIRYFTNGNRYEGEYNDGKFHGKGTHYFADGGVYEGTFLNGKANGYGVRVSSSGERYEGAWKDNQFHGFGIYFFATGERYEGGWLNDQQHGPGTLFKTDETYIQQVWELGKRIQ
ncbi:MAG: hypothetical protein HON65_00940 [Rhodospirillales bacterium]|jgi:hypothetical protein|nr:hypothetical protein [Rhodospirillales bacterium]